MYVTEVTVTVKQVFSSEYIYVYIYTYICTYTYIVFPSLNAYFE